MALRLLAASDRDDLHEPLRKGDGPGRRTEEHDLYSVAGHDDNGDYDDDHDVDEYRYDVDEYRYDVDEYRYDVDEYRYDVDEYRYDVDEYVYDVDACAHRVLPAD